MEQPKYPHEQIVRDLMKSKKYRGNMKDYAILTGNRMMDFKGTYRITRADTESKIEPETILLIHKKWLHRFVVEHALFWNRKIGIRETRHVKVVPEVARTEDAEGR